MSQTAEIDKAWPFVNHSLR